VNLKLGTSVVPLGESNLVGVAKGANSKGAAAGVAANVGAVAVAGSEAATAESCSTTLPSFHLACWASTLPSFSRAASSAVRPFCVLSDASAPDESRSGTQSSHPSDAA